MNAVKRFDVDAEEYVTLLREYLRYLERNYGVSVDQLTDDLFDHLKAEAERNADPRSAVLRMAYEAGLVPCGVMFPNVNDIRKYNSYVLALREYALENGLKIQKATGAVFCNVGEPAVIVPYMDRTDRNGPPRCGFKIFDLDGRFLASGPDIGDTIALARENVRRMSDDGTLKP